MTKIPSERFTLYHVKSTYLDGEFAVFVAKYGNGSTAVTLADDEGEETVSINLVAYDLVPPSPDMFYVKNYSEHEGLAAGLVRAGIAEFVDMTSFGQYVSTSATLLRLIVTPSNGMPR